MGAIPPNKTEVNKQMFLEDVERKLVECLSRVSSCPRKVVKDLSPPSENLSAGSEIVEDFLHLFRVTGVKSVFLDKPALRHNFGIIHPLIVRVLRICLIFNTQVPFGYSPPMFSHHQGR